MISLKGWEKANLFKTGKEKSARDGRFELLQEAEIVQQPGVLREIFTHAGPKIPQALNDRRRVEAVLVERQESSDRL